MPLGNVDSKIQKAKKKSINEKKKESATGNERKNTDTKSTVNEREDTTPEIEMFRSGSSIEDVEIGVTKTETRDDTDLRNRIEESDLDVDDTLGDDVSESHVFASSPRDEDDVLINQSKRRRSVDKRKFTKNQKKTLDKVDDVLHKQDTKATDTIAFSSPLASRVFDVIGAFRPRDEGSTSAEVRMLIEEKLKEVYPEIVELVEKRMNDNGYVYPKKKKSSIENVERDGVWRDQLDELNDII